MKKINVQGGLINLHLHHLRVIKYHANSPGSQSSPVLAAVVLQVSGHLPLSQ